MKREDENGYARFDLGTIGRVISTLAISSVGQKCQIQFAGCYYWYYNYELELVEYKECINQYSDVQRNVTVEEVEKFEEELRRKDSELRDLKELIIKLLFDRYGY